jgi:hypothetical protein
VPGPPPKDPSKRARRNAGQPFRQLDGSVRDRKRAPNWPLPRDAREALLPGMLERVDDLRGQLDDEQDGRRRRRLQAQLVAAEQDHVLLKAELDIQRKVEREIWTALWRTPMAAEWERLKWTRTLARYARVAAEAELGGKGSAKARQEARILEHAHGLTPMSLQSLRWQIVAGEGQEAGGRAPAPGVGRWRGHLSAVRETTAADG